MKRLFTLLLLLFTGYFSAYSQGLNANLAFARFYNPEMGPYVETYLAVETQGLKLMPNADGKYFAKVNVLLLLKQNDSIVDFSKTQLQSPVIEDTNHINFNFIDQQRFFIPNGTYELEIEMSDANTDKPAVTSTGQLTLNFAATDSVQMSDIEFLNSYEPSMSLKVNTKNGLDMVPHVSTFFKAETNPMMFYVELYNLQKVLGQDGDFLVNAFVSDLKNTKPVADLFVRQRMKAKEVNALINKFELSDLPSGNYLLNVEVRNKQNELLKASKAFFQVSNSNISFNEAVLADIESNSYFNKMSEDTLTRNIKSLLPIANSNERVFIVRALKKAELAQKQKFFSYFWTQRDQLHPIQAWLKYELELKKVDASFGNKYTPGFDTDRGRVYLKYGPPNTIVDREFDASSSKGNGSVPYQIWHYYNIGSQGNCKFVFYNPNLVHNGYKLLHSNVIGEINNPHWQNYLIRKQLNGIDAPQHDVYEGGTGEYYNNPF